VECVKCGEFAATAKPRETAAPRENLLEMEINLRMKRSEDEKG